MTTSYMYETCETLTEVFPKMILVVISRLCENACKFMIEYASMISYLARKLLFLFTFVFSDCRKDYNKSLNWNYSLHYCFANTITKTEIFRDGGGGLGSQPLPLTTPSRSVHVKNHLIYFWELQCSLPWDNI